MPFIHYNPPPPSPWTKLDLFTKLCKNYYKQFDRDFDKFS